MISGWLQSGHKTLALMLVFVLLGLSVPAQQQADYTFRVQSDLVLVNVTVKDKSGNFVQRSQARRLHYPGRQQAAEGCFI